MTPRTMAQIASEIAQEHRVKVSDLKGGGRQQAISAPRQAFMAAAMAEHRWSLGQVGRFLGGRHHATIIHGVKAHWAREERAYG